jgi:NAD(P)-dependent dehydrogenase (short-subunit alcohol dehydrogenase family)
MVSHDIRSNKAHPVGRPLAMVIGGSGGLGGTCVRRLAQRNRLLLVDADAARAVTEAERLSREGYEVTSFTCDITKPDQVEALAALAGEHGGLNILAHVAGLSPSMADWRTIMGVNLVGAALVERALRPQMLAGGAAVFISSLGGHIVPADPALLPVLDAPLEDEFLERLEAVAGAALNPSTAYAWSKLGLMRMCQRRAGAWGQAGVRINALSPGLIASPMGEREFVADQRKAQLLARIPLGRQGTMAEVADAVEFLCSDRASYINGTDLLMDGGVAAALRFGTYSYAIT